MCGYYMNGIHRDVSLHLPFFVLTTWLARTMEIVKTVYIVYTFSSIFQTKS